MRLAVALVVTAACGEPAIEMKLLMPPAAQGFDMSCVGAVDLLPIPNNDAKSLDIGFREYNDMIRQPCVELAHAPASFDDLQSMISGQFDIALPPEGLAGIELRGRSGKCNEMPAYRESIFYGGAEYTNGQDQIGIQLAHNISCDTTTSYTVRTVDLINLVQTKQCAVVTNAGSQVFAGTIRPTLMTDIEPMLFEDGVSYGNLKDGAASINTFKSTWAGSCPAVGWEDANFNVTASCINPGAPGACAAAGEVELPIMDYVYANNSVDSMLEDQFGAPMIGDVWTTAGTAGPVAGATITVDMGSTAKIVYGDPGASGFVPAMAATATTASGMYMIYGDGIIGITVSAPGKASRHVWLGGQSDIPSTSIVVVN
jgi:hypothetical protein